MTFGVDSQLDLYVHYADHVFKHLQNNIRIKPLIYDPLTYSNIRISMVYLWYFMLFV